MTSTDVVAKDAAIKRSQPSEAVAKTLIRMAIGAARAAPAVSSEMWAAESSVRLEVKLGMILGQNARHTPCKSPHRRVESHEEGPAIYRTESSALCPSMIMETGRTVAPARIVFEVSEGSFRRHPLVPRDDKQANDCRYRRPD